MLMPGRSVSFSGRLGRRAWRQIMCDAREGLFEELGEGSDNAFYLSRVVDTYRVSAETWYRSQIEGSCLHKVCDR